MARARALCGPICKPMPRRVTRRAASRGTAGRPRQPSHRPRGTSWRDPPRKGSATALNAGARQTLLHSKRQQQQKIRSSPPARDNSPADCGACANPSDTGHGNDGHDRYSRALRGEFFTNPNFSTVRCTAAPSTFLLLAKEMTEPEKDAKRIEFQLEAMRKGQSISPPELVLQFATGRASKQLRVQKHDGRHRCAACSSLGCRTIPMMVSLDLDVKKAFIRAAKGKAEFAKSYTVLSEQDAHKGARPCGTLTLTVTGNGRIVGALTEHASKCADEDIQAQAALRRKAAEAQAEAEAKAALSLKKARAKQAAESKAAVAARHAAAKAAKAERDAYAAVQEKEQQRRQAQERRKSQAAERKAAERERDRERRQAKSDREARKNARETGEPPRFHRELAEVSDTESSSSEDENYNELLWAK